MVNDTEPVLAEVWRGDYLESTHRGSVVVTGPDGRVRLAMGDVTSPMLPRSALKPFQAVAMLRAGLDLDGAELALVGASHSGERFHREAVVTILEGAGLGVDDLQTTPGLPFSQKPMAEWLAEGHGKEAVAHNCSGKHAGMLRTCVRAGWRLDDYREPTHPLQVASREVIAEFTGEPVGDPVVDGCGAPAFATTLTGLAIAFGRLASARDGAALRVADAFRAHPEYASGTDRDELVFHREVPGLVCKLGAEGAFAIGLADGTGIAIKIADGNHRGNPPVLVAVLDALGLATDALRALDPYPVLGHGDVVGRVSAAPGFLDPLSALNA